MDLRLVYMTCVCFNPHFLWPSRVTTPGTHTPSCYVSLFISLLRDFDEGSENTSVVIPSWWRPSVKIIALEIVERGTFSFIARVSLINSKGSRESPLAWSGCKFRLHVSGKTGALINARQLSTRVERRYATIRSSTRTSSGRLVIEQSRSRLNLKRVKSNSGLLIRSAKSRRKKVTEESSLPPGYQFGVNGVNAYTLHEDA